MSAAAAKNRQLPEKEAKLFKTLLTQYELKQYKKGVKAADTILKKFPNHGETLAIKALTLHSSLPIPATLASQPKEEEAEAMARLAVKKDMGSHITWHVLGILAKSRKDYEEASRAFAMARKIDQDNIPLIRDFISLSLHTRQFNQALAARHHYLMLRPQIRSSWLGLMISHQLCGDLEEAIRVYDGYVSTVKDEGASQSEKNQIALHVVKMCIELGRFEEGLQRLENGLRDGVISSRGESLQLKAETLINLGRTDEAEDTYRALLEQNSDNLEYYRGFLRTRGLDITSKLDGETINKVLKALQAFSESYPRSAAPRRLALDIAEGAEFEDLARKYLINGLERGVPSLFVDVKGVYTSPAKMAKVGEILETLISQLESDSSLHNDSTISPPTTLLWAYYYLALHLSHPLHPNPSHQRSLDLLDKALEHTPTLPEIYMAKAMVLKRAGDPLGAAHAMEEARLLDGQDRFLNGKAGKYWLRAGEVQRAEDILTLFIKKDTNITTDQTELQVLWYLQEEGDAYRRNGNLGMALKRYQAVAKVFDDYEDDQYDFHTYCLRRMTLSAYISLMKYEDQLRSHPGYFKASLAAIDIYVKLHDNPSLAEEKLTPDEEAERKKAQKKAQKAESKAKKAALTSGDASKKEDAPIPDLDPEGKGLLKTETPLEDALKLWKPLEKLAAGRVETWTKGYEIYIRQKLWLAALKCLLAAREIDAENPDLHWQILHFRRIVEETKDFPAPIKSAIDSTFPTLLPTSTSPTEYNESFLSSHSSSPSHILAYCRALLETSPEKSSERTESLIKSLNKLVEPNTPPSIPILSSAVELLKSAGGSEEQIEDFRGRCKERVPLAWVFATKEEKESRKFGTETEEAADA